MKTPAIDWENSSEEFRRGFGVADREAVEEIIISDVARAQRMAATGLRHLRAILEANKLDGIRDRWRRDALAPVYFGATSSVAAMRSVRERLERAHRRLRDNRLHIRMRPQSARPQFAGCNFGGVFSPNRFQLFPSYAGLNDAQRASVIVHELLHEWLKDEKIGDVTVRGDEATRRLASRDPEKARRNPENFEHFLLQVWKDEGLEAPSGAEKRDTPLIIAGVQVAEATGLLSDRPVITEVTTDGRRDLLFVALRARSDDTMIPAIFETDARPLARRGGETPTGAISFAPSLCTLPSGIIVAAVRGAESRTLKLISYKTVGETVSRVADSGDLYGDCYSQPDIIAVGGGRMVVLFKGESGKMKIDLVNYDSLGNFRRVANAETSAPIDDHGTACLVSPVDELTGGPQADPPGKVVIATAMRTREGKLSVNLWTGDFGLNKVSRHGGLEDRKITGRPEIAALAKGDRPRVVTAVRDEDTGRLRLTAFDVADPTRPRRMGDTGLEGPRMTHSPAILTVMEGFEQQVATAIRYSETGRIIVSTWAVPDDSDGFIRHRYSGASGTPVIDSTPSLSTVFGNQSEVLFTAAIGADGTLALQAWEEGDPE